MNCGRVELLCPYELERRARMAAVASHNFPASGLSWYCAARPNWPKALARARRRACFEIQKSAAQPTANSADRNLTAVMAVPNPAVHRISQFG
jgi:hypothetical protein